MKPRFPEAGRAGCSSRGLHSGRGSRVWSTPANSSREVSEKLPEYTAFVEDVAVFLYNIVLRWISRVWGLHAWRRRSGFLGSAIRGLLLDGVFLCHLSILCYLRIC